MTLSYNADAPVLGLVIDPADDTAAIVPIDANTSGVLARVVGGALEVIELDGGSVMWIDSEGKNRRMPTNLLATKVAHRLHAGLYPDDTINGRAVILGEIEIDGHGPVAADLTPLTYTALTDLNVALLGQASQEVFIAAGGTHGSPLSHSNAGGGCMVTTLQVDDAVYAVGQDDFTVCRYTVATWLGEDDEAVTVIEAESTTAAWAILKSVAEGAEAWTCADCGAALFRLDATQANVRCGQCDYSNTRSTAR